MADFHQLLSRVARQSGIPILGIDDVDNEPHAVTAARLIEAFGSASAGFVYLEPSLSGANTRTPDIVLCHPDVGLVVIEVKGHDISEIVGVEAGNLFVSYQGRRRPVNPFEQARKCMFEVRASLVRRGVDEMQMPVFEYLVALPRISANDWTANGYHECLDTSRILFADELNEAAILRGKIAGLVRTVLQKTGRSNALRPEIIAQLKSCFGDSASINNGSRVIRAVPEESVGYTIDEMDAEEKYLTEAQKALSMRPITDSPRLVRGVAGSGKSIVLANQVARVLKRAFYTDAQLELNLDGPQMIKTKPRILVVCFNRAFVSYLREKIRVSYEQQTLQKELPGEDHLFISHFNNVIYELRNRRGLPIDYIRVGEVGDPQERSRQYLARLKEIYRDNPEEYRKWLFDYIFVDEGQDLGPDDYRVLLWLLRPTPAGERPISIFYDDAQNLYATPRPNWSEIGLNVVGRSVVMTDCHRNTRPVLNLAFNVLVGTRAPAGSRAATRSYADIQTLRDRDLVRETEDWIEVLFSKREGPAPTCEEFNTRTEEKRWLVKEVKRLIVEEHVQPRDLLIIIGNTREFDELDAMLIEALGDRIGGCLHAYAGRDVDQYIFQEGKITLATPFGAKGYDAFVVFCLGVDLYGCEEQERAAFYVGATRSKYLLYLSGIRRLHHTLLQECKGSLQRARPVSQAQ